MSFATSTELYNKAEISDYLRDIEKTGDIDTELEKIREMLVFLHKPAQVKRVYPNETPESIKKQISKHTQIFRVLLGYREQKRQERAGAILRIRVPDQIEY